MQFAAEHNKSTSDFSWLTEGRKALKGRQKDRMWPTIAQALPHRTVRSVQRRGAYMFHTDNNKVRANGQPLYWLCNGSTRGCAQKHKVLVCKHDRLHK